MSRKLLYLACPYGHKSEMVRRERFEIASRTAGRLAKLGYKVFSPISHSHPLHIMESMPHDWEFWKSLDSVYLELSYKLVVIQIDGWAESVGVTDEIQMARAAPIPVVYLSPVYAGRNLSDDLWRIMRKSIGD